MLFARTGAEMASWAPGMLRPFDIRICLGGLNVCGKPRAERDATFRVGVRVNS